LGSRGWVDQEGRGCVSRYAPAGRRELLWWAALASVGAGGTGSRVTMAGLEASGWKGVPAGQPPSQLAHWQLRVVQFARKHACILVTSILLTSLPPLPIPTATAAHLTAHLHPPPLTPSHACPHTSLLTNLHPNTLAHTPHLTIALTMACTCFWHLHHMLYMPWQPPFHRLLSPRLVSPHPCSRPSMRHSFHTLPQTTPLPTAGPAPPHPLQPTPACVPPTTPTTPITTRRHSSCRRRWAGRAWVGVAGWHRRAGLAGSPAAAVPACGEAAAL